MLTRITRIRKIRKIRKITWFKKSRMFESFKS